jgi:hypothetical protein
MRQLDIRKNGAQVTMDCFLLAVSAGLTAYLPSRLSHGAAGGKLLPVKAILGLSFCLFSLSVLEATPTAWLFVLSNETSNKEGGIHAVKSAHAGLSVSFAYKLILCCLASAILIIFPSIIGTFLVSRLFFFMDSPNNRQKKSDSREYKKKEFLPKQHSNQHSVLCRLAMKMTEQCLTGGCFLSNLIFGRLSLFGLKRLPRLMTTRGPILALTNQDRRSLNWHFIFGSSRGNFATSTTKYIVLGTVLGVGSIIAMLQVIAPRVISTNHGDFNLAKAVSWICALGIIISSVLNGFGSVSMPFSCLVGVYLEPINAKTICQAETELDSVRASLASRKVDLVGARLDVKSNMNSLPSSTNGSPTRRCNGFADIGDDLSLRRKVLSEEIDFLNTLVEEMTNDVDDMRSAQRLAVTARTPLGRVRAAVGVVFSLILLIHLFSVVIVLWPTKGPPLNQRIPQPRNDFVTKSMLWISGYNLMAEEDFNLLSQCISLVLTAFFSFSQIRFFVQTATAVSKWGYSVYQQCFCHKDKRKAMSLSDAISADQVPVVSGVVYPIIASLMGSYFLACVVLTKQMLPKEYRAAFSVALGDDEFIMKSYTINAIFGVSALLSGLILGAKVCIQQQNSYLRRRVYSKGPNHLLAKLDP